jgi:hypothetical protein
VAALRVQSQPGQARIWARRGITTQGLCYTLHAASTFARLLGACAMPHHAGHGHPSIGGFMKQHLMNQEWLSAGIAGGSASGNHSTPHFIHDSINIDEKYNDRIHHVRHE